jgi:hypothetical protein
MVEMNNKNTTPPREQEGEWKKREKTFADARTHQTNDTGQSINLHPTEIGISPTYLHPTKVGI